MRPRCAHRCGLGASLLLALVITACRAVPPATSSPAPSSSPTRSAAVATAPPSPATATPTSPTPAVSPTVTQLPTPNGGYAGWQDYAQAEPSFTFRYPPGWVVEPDVNPVSTLYEHALFVHPAGEAKPLALRVVFRAAGDELLLWPTGVGEGEFVARGTTPFGAGRLARQVLVCQGRDQAVWYRGAAGAAPLGDLEFSFILAVNGACADGLSLTEPEQAIGDLLVASFQH